MKKTLKTIFRQAIQICTAAALLCNFVTAQKIKKPLSAEFYDQRGLAKMENGNNVFKKNDSIKERRSHRFYRRIAGNGGNSQTI